MEIKAFPAVSYKANGDGDRVRTGLAAIFGNVDSVGDITHAGSFAKTITEGRKRFKHLWNHDNSQPPIATILDIKEIGRSELPAEILAQAPDATGGLWVKREYYADEFSNRVLHAIDNGDVTEMSFAYDVIKADDSDHQGKTVRNLRELALYDTSDVNFGANSATLANLKGLIKEMPLGWIVQQLAFYDGEVKAGRRNSGSDQILINALHDISMSLGCDSCKPADEPKSLELPPIDEAEAAHKSTSLDFLKLKAQRLALMRAITLTN